jgi:hypothetical protein
MAEEKKKSRKKKEEEVVETPIVQEEVVSEQPMIEDVQPVAEVVVPSVFKVEGLDEAIDEVMSEELKEVVKEETEKEVKKHFSSTFTTEEKLYIIKLISDGYRPFDIVKKARFNLKLSEEKMNRLSFNIRSVDALIKALEG